MRLAVLFLMSIMSKETEEYVDSKEEVDILIISQIKQLCKI